MFLKNLRTAIFALALFTILIGLFYPLVVTGIAQLVFPHRANASLIEKNGKTFGSELIGQPFSSPKYFWSHLRQPVRMHITAVHRQARTLGRSIRHFSTA